MELINTDLSWFNKDLPLSSDYRFKQDPKLVAAIDKLFNGQTTKLLENQSMMLPERKLKFSEVQDLLKQNNTKLPIKSSHVLLKEINDTRKLVITKVENILNEVNKSADNGDIPKLIIRNQRLWSNCIYDLDRELFYQNVTRLRNQANLDVAVRDVCCLLETPPWKLGIVATSKGLVAGPLTMHYRNGSVIDCMVAGGVLIPQNITGIVELQSSAKYILVVEKDAIFQKLLDEGALLRLGPVIIITGKGYPDVCTRQLLCRLCVELQLRALALVDADPHGYEIFLTYKYGSLAQSHLSASLACTSLVLLGALHNDIMMLVPSETRLSLTERDKRKLKSLIKRPYLDTPVGIRLKEEFTTMLSSGIKAEIEALAPTAAALCDAYIPAKIVKDEYLG